jgi:hypothetical protein
MKRLRIHVACFTVALVASLAAFPAAAQCNDGREGVLSDAFVGTTAVEWRMLVEHKAVTLTISAPCGLVVERTYGEGQSPFFDLKEIPAADPDGKYHWSLRISPHVDPALEKELAAAHKNGSDGRELEYQLRQKGLLPAGPFTQSGTFTVFRGSIVPPDEKEEGSGGKLTAGVRPAASVDDCPVASVPAVETARLGTILPAVDRGGSTRAVAAAAETPRRITGADQVIPDDLIVQGSACVGFDCVNNESFSFDTIRLKENNLRIKFEDTSVGSFPTNDWQLTANDSASGGASKFSIEDVNGAKVPFTVTAGASTNSIFVASTGRVGMRTSSPVLDLHISTSNTPGIRLEQTNAGGFTAQTWDIAGNEANFFVRDVTGGSRLPFRIRPDAPTSSIDISADGEVGIGTASPDAALHVERSDGTAQVLVEETSGTEAARELAVYKNNGTVTFRFTDSNGTASEADDTHWLAGQRTNNTFIITPLGTIGTPRWSMDTAGNVTATSFTPSSRALKNDFEVIDERDVLARLVELPLSTWRYKLDQNSLHLGPMAEDFYAAFGLGKDAQTIAVADASGVALAAVKGLHQVVEQKDRRIDELEQRLATMEEMLRRLTAVP